jgi:hypothetical protein
VNVLPVTLEEVILNSSRLKAGLWFASCATLVAVPLSSLWHWKPAILLILILSPIITSGVVGAIFGSRICGPSTTENETIVRGAAVAAIAWAVIGILSILFPGQGESASAVRAFFGFIALSVVGLPVVVIAGMVSAKLLQFACSKTGRTKQ